MLPHRMFTTEYPADVYTTQSTIPPDFSFGEKKKKKVFLGC